MGGAEGEEVLCWECEPVLHVHAPLAISLSGVGLLLAAAAPAEALFRF